MERYVGLFKPQAERYGVVLIFLSSTRTRAALGVD